MAGDFNGYVGQYSHGFQVVHSGYGFGTRNEEGTRLLESCDANDLMICNTNFIKPVSHLITYQSGGNINQVDYLFTRQRDRQLLSNAKSFPDEECTPQHKLLVSDFRIRARKTQGHNPHLKRRLWNLRDSANQQKFRDILLEVVPN
ncbi:craniofacial development protein 2-like [Octopus bimaculoides]|uniref:craniofacial development protein 2-like n=1 Tax=Octopus bimaculoides TaxID=37653 RepID=UPI0022E7D0A8|nr:craniofacial development protein 2-like [Octopus bimaculoides]